MHSSDKIKRRPRYPIWIDRPESSPSQRLELKFPLWKRFLDFAVVLLLLPSLVPLLLFISAFIKIVSPGPVFYTQTRIGFRGRPFKCWKFRTMKAGADSGVHSHYVDRLIEEDLPMEKLDSTRDPRLIPMAAFLRSTGLDELPQIFNILKGDMSFVGPRPCTSYEFEHYQDWQLERFNAVPGITGLWQVNGKNKTTFSEMIRMDIEYFHRQSLALDLRILWRTQSVIWRQFQESHQANKVEKSKA